MARVEKTVFLSYRHTDIKSALLIYYALKHRGFDVFFDFKGLGSGAFETGILENIRARAHFIVILTQTALQRCREPRDWLRLEIEAALDSKRNVVPLLLDGFRFDADTQGMLTGKLAELAHYNGLEISHAYFDAAIDRLERQFLNVRLDAVLHPPSTAAIQTLKELNELLNDMGPFNDLRSTRTILQSDEVEDEFFGKRFMLSVETNSRHTRKVLNKDEHARFKVTAQYLTSEPPFSDAEYTVVLKELGNLIASRRDFAAFYYCRGLAHELMDNRGAGRADYAKYRELGGTFASADIQKGKT